MSKPRFSLTHIFPCKDRIVDSVCILKNTGQILCCEKLKTKPCNRVNSYYYISDDSETPEPQLVPNTVDTPTLDKCSNKELNEAILKDTENATHIKSTNSRHNY